MAKLCVVTGATRGIGRAISARLIDEKYDVIGLARSRPDWWQGEFIECDVLDRTALQRACEQIRNLTDLWGLINNAGVGHADAIPEIRYEDMARVFMANTFAPALLTQAAVATMGEGRIINICSTAMLGKAERSSYGSSKAALASLTRTWALELARKGVTVNAISPGPIETELFRSRNPVGSEGERQQLDAIPIGKFGEPGHVAALVAFLVSQDAYYCTGQVISLDGGMSAGKSPF